MILEGNEGKEEQFYVHSKMLLSSQMLETQDRSLVLSDASYKMLEKNTLVHIHNNTNSLEDWIDLMILLFN